MLRLRSWPLVCVTAGAALVAAPGGVLSQTDPLTMVVTVYRDASFIQTRFSGVASGARAGETIDIMGSDCGRGPAEARLITQTTTQAGGRWQVEKAYIPTAPFETMRSGIELRARWKTHRSAPYVWRLPAELGVKKVPKRTAWRVHVSPPNQYVSMQGKVVQLQRLSKSRWVVIAQAKLVRKPSFTLGAFNHEAVFTVRQRGLRLRAALPAKSAAPCYLPGVSKPWRS